MECRECAGRSLWLRLLPKYLLLHLLVYWLKIGNGNVSGKAMLWNEGDSVEEADS
jgi:hypothetical protein